MKKPSSWLSMAEVLDDLSVSRSTMNDWRARGQAPRFVIELHTSIYEDLG